MWWRWVVARRSEPIRIGASLVKTCRDRFATEKHAPSVPAPDFQLWAFRGRKRMDWYPFYPALYRAATIHLTAEQDGIYRRLIDYYMESRRPLPDNDFALARISGVDISCFKHSSSTIKAFFVHADGVLTHDKCDAMLDKQDEKTRFHQARAKKAANARHSKTNDLCLKPATSKREAMLGDARERVESRDKKESISPNVPFDEFWERYPRKENRKGALKAYETAIKKGFTHENIIGGIERHGEVWQSYPADRRKFIPHASTWLNGERWADPAPEHDDDRTGYERSVANAVKHIHDTTKNQAGMG